MHICLVVEGCYPYIVGGVSSWTQSLILNCPEHEFSIIAINPEKSERGLFKYQLPGNVIEVQEIFLDELMEKKGRWNKNIILKKEQSFVLKELLNGNKVDWHILFDLFKKHKFNSTDLMLSKAFYTIIQDAYGDRYSHIPFTEVFWTLRSMYITLFALIENAYISADLYHCVSTGYSGVVGALAAYRVNKPLMLTEHGIYTREREEEIIKSDWVQGQFKSIWIKYFKNLSDAIYDDSDLVVSLFKKNKDIQIELGCDANKIQVIHNGIMETRFDAIRKVTKGPEDPVVIAGIVRVVPIKDIKTMLQAFSFVNQMVDQVKFLIIGPDDENEEYYQECVEYASILKLTNVEFTGRVDIKDYIGLIDIHVLSSISEGQPLTVLETMSKKIPNITTNVGDCSAMIYGPDDDFGQAGMVVNIMDFNGLANAIVELVKNPELRKLYGENGFKRVTSKYTFDQFINAYKDIYNNFS